MTIDDRRPPPRRPRRSNESLSLERAIQGHKPFYWTKAKLEKLLRRILKNEREEWFAARPRPSEGCARLGETNFIRQVLPERHSLLAGRKSDPILWEKSPANN